MNIFEASENGNQEEVKRALGEGTDINKANIYDGGWTPLMYACRYGQVDMVRFLLDCGADRHINCFQGLTALRVATNYGEFQTVKVLLQYGTNRQHEIHHAAKSLIIACLCKRYDLILLFRKHLYLFENNEKRMLQKGKYRCSLRSTMV